MYHEKNIFFSQLILRIPDKSYQATLRKGHLLYIYQIDNKLFFS